MQTEVLAISHSAFGLPCNPNSVELVLRLIPQFSSEIFSKHFDTVYLTKSIKINIIRVCNITIQTKKCLRNHIVILLFVHEPFN